MADDAKRGLFDVLEDCLMKSSVCNQQHARGEDKRGYTMYVLCTVFCNVHLIKKGNLLFLFLHFAYPYFVQFCNLLRVDVEHTFCFMFFIY